MTEKKKWTKARKSVLGGILIGLAVVLLYLAYRPRAMVVDVGEVTTGRFEQTIDEDGVLRLQNRFVIAAPTSALLRRPSIKVGDSVKAGDVVAMLEPAAPQMIDARTRSVLTERVGNADAARRVAVAQVQRAQTALAQANLEAERAIKLSQENFVSSASRDAAVLARQSAQQALGAAQAELGMRDYSVAEARAALTRAQPNVAAKESGVWALKSPIAGQVIKLHQESAVTVNAGQPLVDIGDTGVMEAVIDVLSSEARRIPPGAPVSLSPGSGASAIAGKVVRVEPVAFTKVSALGIEEQRVNVIVGLDSPNAAVHLGDGFRVDARITVSSEPSALLVPTSALIRAGTHWQAFVVDAGRARAKLVQLRDRSGDVARLKAGLHEGEKVVLYPGSTLQEGQKVMPRESPRP